MIAAIDMQWLGVGIAALIVVVLLIIVLVRHRGEDEQPVSAAPTGQAARPAPAPWTPAAAPPPVTPAPAPPAGRTAGAPGAPTPAPAPGIVAAAAPAAAATTTPAPPSGSFLDEPLARDFEGLGKPSVPPAPPAPAGPFPVDPFGSHEDIFPPQEPAAATAQVAPALTVETVPAPEPAAAPVSADAAAPPQPAASAVAGQATPPPAATPASLSDVIVTNSHEEVDLADPDVRALLVSLVDDEIELAKVCRAQGQTLDAIIQLTEAEKTCTALGLDDTLTQVRALLAELQA